MKITSGKISELGEAVKNDLRMRSQLRVDKRVASKFGRMRGLRPGNPERKQL